MIHVDVTDFDLEHSSEVQKQEYVKSATILFTQINRFIIYKRIYILAKKFFLAEAAFKLYAIVPYIVERLIYVCNICIMYVKPHTSFETMLRTALKL